MAKAAKKTKESAREGGKAAARGGNNDVTVKPGKSPAPATTTPFQDLERVFEEFLNRRWLRPSGWEWPRLGEISSRLDRQMPSVDIVDGDKEVVVRAELPGVEKKDIDVSIVERTLTIKASTRKEQKEESDSYFRQEIRTGSFSRSVLLPADVNAQKAQASFKGGVLELRLPKARTVKPQKVPLSS
jgi:HSP20 family protein